MSIARNIWFLWYSKPFKLISLSSLLGSSISDYEFLIHIEDN